MVINNTNSRNSIFLYNTVLNFVFKVCTFVLNFWSIPLLLQLLNAYHFGIWEIAFTVTTYALILNFGLGNSLRNLISLNLVYNKKSKINRLITVTFILSIILSVLFIVIFAVIYFIQKSAYFNLTTEVFWFLFTTFISFCINIVLNTFASIANALQKSYLISIYSFIQSLIFLSALFIINFYNLKNPLILVGLSFNVSNIITNLLLGIHLYKKNNWLKIEFPSHKIKQYSVFIFSIGKNFAIVQLATLFLFSADSIIIGVIYKIDAIVAYAVINKLYFYIITVFSIFLVQLWNSTTNAFAAKDFNWINKIKHRLELLIVPVIVFIIILNIFSEQLFSLWVGTDFKVNKSIVLLLGIYTIFHIWCAIYVNILNGMGILKQQITLYIIGNIFLIISSVLIYFFKFDIEYFVLSKTIIIIVLAIGMYKSYENEIKKA